VYSLLSAFIGAITITVAQKVLVPDSLQDLTNTLLYQFVSFAGQTKNGLKHTFEAVGIYHIKFLNLNFNFNS